MLMTDLLDERRYPADDLLEAYLARWRIERVFQQITEVFALEHLIGSTARATIFQAAFCLVLYNLIQVVRAYLASGRAGGRHDRGALRRADLLRCRGGSWAACTSWSAWRSWPPASIGRGAREEMRAWLERRLGGVWTERWKKAVNKKPRPKKPAVGSCYRRP